eukprot:508365-Rhodomonas_salina.1
MPLDMENGAKERCRRCDGGLCRGREDSLRYRRKEGIEGDKKTTGQRQCRQSRPGKSAAI